MAETIRPDVNCINEIINSGGESLKKCFQCATCSAVCNVTPDDHPFPRKEMLHAQWGLKDKLFSNPDIWLCHQCSDCTAYCPRGAKPGEVLAAVRRMSIRNYSKPGFLSKAVENPKALLLLLAVPTLIFLLITAFSGSLFSVPRGMNNAIVYSKFIPITFIDIVFMSASFFAAVSFSLSIVRYWKDMAKTCSMPQSGTLKSIILTVIEILVHRRFGKCDLTKGRQISHLFVFYSFIGLTITTSMAVWYLYGLKWESPYPLTNILKIIGNSSAVILLAGITLIVLNRFRNKEKAGLGTYFDWLFIGVIYVIVLTGILAEVFRLQNISFLAYPTYFSHLVAVFFLFAYAPFSKMAHMVYRAAAMVFARVTKRETQPSES